MKYLILGNGVAGINAANVVRNRDRAAEITIISSESDHFFSRTALMYVMCGQLSERCVEPFERDHYERMNFRRIRARAGGVDVAAQNVILEDGEAVPYDRLLIAAGSVPVMLPWPGADLEGVGNFVRWQDLEWMQKQARTARRAVVVGGGLIGIESVEVLKLAGIDVSFLIREESYWPVALDPNEATVITDHMRHHGIDVRLGTEMTEILGRDGKVSGVRTNSGETINCDMVIVAIGVRPQTDWLENTGLEMDERGGLIVDEYLATNIPTIYAAGDCTSVVWFNGIRRPEQLWYTSRDQGKIAGCNLVGDRKAYHRGTFYNSAKFFDIEYTTAGLVNFNVDKEQNWYQQEPGAPRTARIVHLPDGTVIGFNALGRRWDHRVWMRWIEEGRNLNWVLDHINDALFDEEFMPTFTVVAGRL